MTQVSVTLNQDGRSWDVVRGAEVIATYATIKEAHTAKSELSRRAPRKVVGFGQDGTDSTRRAA